MMPSILACPICTPLPQKSSGQSPPPGAESLDPAPGDMRRCPECHTWYYYNHEYDPGEPFIPSSDTYTLARYTPVLARAALRGLPDDQQAAAQPLLDALMREWDAIHAALVASLDGPLPALPHIVKYIVESLSDYWLEKNDRAAFRDRLFGSRNPAVRANAATDILYVATEEHSVWAVRMFSRHQQTLAAEWLKDDAFTQAILQTLAGCLGDEDETLLLDPVLGYLERSARVIAYSGLGNAFFRKLDPTPIVPALLAALFSSDRDRREIAARLLQDAVDAQPAVKPVIRQALAAYAGEVYPEIARVQHVLG